MKGKNHYKGFSLLAVLVGFGMAIYFTLVHISGAQKLGLLLRRLRRG